MKKLILVGLIGLTLCVSGAFAQDQHPTDKWGIGVQGGGSFGWGLFGWGGALTLKIPAAPIFFVVDGGIGSGYFRVGVSGDYYFIDKTFSPEAKLGWYLGGGIYINFSSWTYVSLGAGAHLPIGLSWHPIDLIEVYLQAVPSIGVSIPFSDASNHNWFDWGVGGNLGIRFWF
ncbi:hypothetical protein AGMMS49579_09320 [Spirochaetia bacterium]|nr:hypothetical protein AGMMS49579_09320 [Spirochaetia bacterium]